MQWPPLLFLVCNAEQYCKAYPTIFTYPWNHRVIMYFVETKATSRLPYFGHLPVDSYLSVLSIAAVTTELGGY